MRCAMTEARYQCDGELAKMGVKRTDLPLAAYDVLTRES
jgi:hypothetical protein